MIKDEMKMRVDDLRDELIEQKETIKWLLEKIIDLGAQVNSLEVDLECEDE